MLQRLLRRFSSSADDDGKRRPIAIPTEALIELQCHRYRQCDARRDASAARKQYEENVVQQSSVAPSLRYVAPRPLFPLRKCARRLEILHSLCLLDTPPEVMFDAIVALAQQIHEVPIVLISLIDEKRQWFKSKIGLDTDSTSRCLSFCGHAIHDPHSVFVIHDSRADDRFRNNPLVQQAPHVIFYAGAPLVIGGEAIGTLCLIDHTPHPTFDDAERASLRTLADTVENLIRSRLLSMMMEQNPRHLKRRLLYKIYPKSVADRVMQISPTPNQDSSART